MGRQGWAGTRWNAARRGLDRWRRSRATGFASGWFLAAALGALLLQSELGAGLALGSDPNELCAVCWSVPSAALLARVTDLGLTRRELQVARCAASGTSNLLIARHLGISRRTVEAHLRSVYLKAQVQNRTSLANLLLGGPA